jgi:hypothetical protein
MGVKDLGEFGIVGAAAAVANAIFYATSKRVRDFPITIDKWIAPCRDCDTALFIREDDLRFAPDGSRDRSLAK